ncbi:MAG TPA: squalene--hopene cyclase [Candidatus Polarisedimenticolaceae bacterium]|nr:squalene--hopene cyclase [Candidatus Polarisedimenticolaceae bacterium]
MSRQLTTAVPVTETPDDLRFRAREAIESSQRHLLAIQNEDGHWCGELEGDTILESEYILAMHFLGRTHEDRVRKAANYLRDKQLPGGGWGVYPGGPAEVSASTKAYFVLKLVGDDPDAPHMSAARRTIRALGGLDACNSFTKIYLAVFGQLDWDDCPSVPPELILFPRWFYINIYEMSSWSRAILVPLSIISARRPHCPVPAAASITELRVDGYRPARRSAWAALFHALDAGIKLVLRFPFRATREVAIKRCEQWIVERLRDSDGLGAIFPPIVNTIFALHAVGYDLDHPTIRRQVDELERLELEEGDTLRVQPCFSPVWDTAIAINALIESGFSPKDPAIRRAAEWLMHKRGNDEGDWRLKGGHAAGSGWFFEYANPFYPDCDTTSQVITSLCKVDVFGTDTHARVQQAIFEAHQWHLSMQNPDGGWAAFDRGCDKRILLHVPYADHNAMLDPSTADLTARGLESLAAIGFDRSYPPAARAIEFLKREQEADGSWFGRWGCNYLYGTWLALTALERVGFDMRSSRVERAARWIGAVQNDDGGWGELPLSYDDPTSKGIGPSTASQTAWALLGLIAAGEVDSRRVVDGVEYLLREQRADGSWQETHWTGTGFPGVFYLRYHLYPVYFPLLALGAFERAMDRRAKGRRSSRRLAVAPSARTVAV